MIDNDLLIIMKMIIDNFSTNTQILKKGKRSN